MQGGVLREDFRQQIRNLTLRQQPSKYADVPLPGKRLENWYFLPAFPVLSLGG